MSITGSISLPREPILILSYYYKLKTWDNAFSSRVNFSFKRRLFVLFAHCRIVAHVQDLPLFINYQGESCCVTWSLHHGDILKKCRVADHVLVVGTHLDDLSSVLNEKALHCCCCFCCCCCCFYFIVLPKWLFYSENRKN